MYAQAAQKATNYSMMIKKKKTLQTGLDIGSSSIKLVQLIGNPNEPTLVNLDLIKTKDDDDRKKALKALSQRLTSKDVNVSISGPQVVVRYVELPKMSHDELKSSMKFEAEKYIPFKVEDVILDCQILESAGQGKVRVLLAAAKKDVVNKQLNMVQEAGFVVRIIDCDSFAITNAFLLNFSALGEDTNTALINIGNKLTSVNILKGKMPYFTRELQFGGADFAKSLSEKLNIDAFEASKLIEEPKGRLNEVMDCVRSTVMHMVEEIRLSLSYYENEVGAVADNVYLSGGLVRLEGITGLFNENFGIECKLWDPFKSLTPENEAVFKDYAKARSQFPVALGLALRR